MAWRGSLQELGRLAPTALLIGLYIWFTRRQMGGFGGAGGMGGGRGIFNVGKAQARCAVSSPCSTAGGVSEPSVA
jgi:AFG3 family protein